MATKEITALISGIKRMEIHDGNGLRTTVFFKGCPLKCVWCHNPESISYKPQTALFREKCVGCGSCVRVCSVGAVSNTSGKTVIDHEKCRSCFKCAEVCPVGALVGYGRAYTVDELLDEITLDAPFFANGNGGVTLSGGECLTQPEAVIEIARRLHDMNISVDIDTCGYVSREILERVARYADTFLYDIKAVDRNVHHRCTGHDNDLILDNLRYLSENGCRIEVRFPLVVGLNDTETAKIAEMLSGMRGVIGVKVLRYHNLSASRYDALGMKNTLPEPLTTDADVESAMEIFKKQGVHVVNDI